MSDERNIILPDWDVPKNVRAMVTTRQGGVSKPPFDSFNLANHVGDESESVTTNRQILCRDWLLPRQPYWLNQTHSTNVIEVTDKTTERDGDASWTQLNDTVCGVMTADCLPILLYQRDPQAVAAIHAGWRGLLDGVIENTIAALPGETAGISVWLGPAIGPSAFEIGAEVKTAFLESDSGCQDCFSTSNNAGKYMADLYHLAKRRLNKLAINDISGGDFCTYYEQQHFYSYRRDGMTGRMASLIWLGD